MDTAIINCKIYTGSSVETGKAIVIRDGKIVDVVPEALVPKNSEIKDLNGSNIGYSFIDLQIYGGNGKMFSHELSVASLASTYEYCKSGGCSHFMITMATNSISNFLKGIAA